MTTKEVKTHLVNDSIVEGATGWTCQLGEESQSPDKMVTIYASGGPQPMKQFGSTANTQPSFQIRVRGEAHKYIDTETQCIAILGSLYKALIGTYRVTETSSSPIFLEKDESNRPIFSLNITGIDVGGY